MSHAKLPGVSALAVIAKWGKSADLDRDEIMAFLAESSLIAMRIRIAIEIGNCEPLAAMGRGMRIWCAFSH
jgi:hypothetical protein